MGPWHSLGPHRYRLHGNIFWLQTAGEFTGAQTHDVIDQLVEWQKHSDDCGALVDVRRGIAVPAETRRVMAQRSGEGAAPLPMAVIGAGLAARAVLTLMATAVRVIQRAEVPVAFCETEDEATAWLQLRIVERAERLRTGRRNV